MAKNILGSANKAAKEAKRKSSETPDKPTDGGWRETVESLAMAVILALLFKGFVAEAFVIPTGSMAPTLQGRHRDIQCPQCDYRYQTSASEEVDQRTGNLTGNHVLGGTCPVCRFTHEFDPQEFPNEDSFSGDRIIVSKFAYELTKPKRWDVIVFKFPEGATQNYIKRLVGLPGETLEIAGGNIFVQPTSAATNETVIARKPPHKLTAMLQLVDDSTHIPQLLKDQNWPHRWRDTLSPANDKLAWETADGGSSFTCAQVPSGMAWLRYRHLVPTAADWQLLQEKKLPEKVNERRGQLITDFYAYNSSVYHRGEFDDEDARNGLHWVDDLAVECLVEVQDPEGSVGLDLVRAGVHHRCMIDVKTGVASLSMTNAAGNPLSFVDEKFTSVPNPTGQTAVKGAGTYRLRLTNCDHQMLLFVNGWVVKFDQPTLYDSDDIVVPQWNAQDGLDLEPAGVGVSGLRAKVSQLRIYRDKYYIAVRKRESDFDYPPAYDYKTLPRDLQQVFRTPEQWKNSGAFDVANRNDDSRYIIKDNEYFPMGDNSPSSSDGRYWEPVHYLTEDLLIGKALVIYWPHSWNRPVPFTPNVQRMGLIK